jgi:NADPH:quinone reductase-like Zn-dependent oxidoreductase
MPSPIFKAIARVAIGVRGPRRPILGADLAGVVEAIGERVSSFRVGDAVVAATGFRMGAHAELACVSERAAVIPKPQNLSFRDAAAIPFGGITALQFLRDLGRLRAGERLLVVGASGAVGLAAVQIGKHLGAFVAGVCGPGNVGLVRSIGADDVVDYTTRDFAIDSDFAKEPGRFDVVLDTVGATTFARCKPVLKAKGRFLPAVLTMREIAQMASSAFSGGPRVRSTTAMENAGDLAYLMDLTERGVLRPVIDSVHPLADIAMAHERVDTGRKVGTVLIACPRG